MIEGNIVDCDTVDSTILAAAVSALVSLLILGISSFYIQPRRIRHSWAIEHLQRRLEVYGALNTLLESMQAKNERSPINLPEISKNYTYRMENPFDYKRMVQLLEKKNYLLSKEVSNSWLEVLKQDKTCSIYTSLRGGHGDTNFDFTEMHKRVKIEYAEIKKQFENETGIKLSH